MMKKRNVKIICLMLVIVMMFTVVPVWAVGENTDWEHRIIDAEEHPGQDLGRRGDIPIFEETASLIRATLTSAIDGLPFLAFFDGVTGRISFFGMDGESRGYQYVDDEEAFWELVAFNAEFTSMPIEQRMRAKGIIVEHGADGNRTVTNLGDEVIKAPLQPEILPIELKSAEILPSIEMFSVEQDFQAYVDNSADNSLHSFDTGLFDRWVVWSLGPGTHTTRLAHQFTSWNTTHIVVQVGNNVPHGSVVDFHIVNDAGTNWNTFMDLGNNAIREHFVPVANRGNRYGVFVNVFNNAHTGHIIRVGANTVQQQTVTSPAITTPDSNWQTLLVNDAVLRWSTVPGAAFYGVTLELLHNNGTVERAIWSSNLWPHTHISFPNNFCVAGRLHRLSVTAIVGGVNSAPYHRYFWASSWAWPVPGSHTPSMGFSSFFGAPRDGGTRTHTGIDISRNLGVGVDPVVAFVTGNIVFSGFRSASVGQAIFINTPNLNGFSWIQHRYAHLHTGSLRGLGNVDRGTQIALLGDTGAISGNGHLHFETRSWHEEPNNTDGGSTPRNPIATFFSHIPQIANHWQTSNGGFSLIDTDLNYSEMFGEPCSISDIFVDPTGIIPYTVANLSALPQEYVRSLNIPVETFQALINRVGMEVILSELQGMGLEHVGFTMQADGILTTIDK